jgi:ZIP family zinc transporter
MNSTVGFALLLSALAGLSTTLGSLMGIFIRKPGPRFMALTLGFSGGVMILVSFVELLQGGSMPSVSLWPTWPSSAGWW